MTASPDGLTLRDCLRAAHTITATPGGRRARAAVRPRTVGGFARDRAPLALVLYTASRDQRLVWQGLDGFALLEPPLTRPRATRWWGLRHAVADWVDKHWSTLVLAVPPAVSVLGALPVLLFPAFLWPAVGLGLFAMLYVVAFLTTSLVKQLIYRRSPGADATRLRLLSGTHWTMTLFHQTNEQRIDELFDRVRERLRHLLVTETTTFGSQAGIGVDEARLIELLVCLHDGVTTHQAQERIVDRHPDMTWRDGAEFSVATFQQHPDDVDRAPAPPLAFIRFYLVANVVVLLGLAQLVSWQEQSACANRPCRNAATSYGDALTWLAYQLVWRPAPNVEPVSGFAVVLGWLLTPILPLAILAAITASLRYKRYLATFHDPLAGRSSMRTRLLIVTVTDAERDAIIDTFDEYTGRESVPDFSARVPTVRLGEIADTEVFLIQVATVGGIGASAVSTVAGEAIRALKPHCAIIAGICYGLKPEEQELGDVLVSAIIRDLDHAKLKQVNDEVVRQDRGERVAPSPALHVTSLAVQRQFQRRSGITVRFGEMLSWNKLIHADLVIADLRKRYPDAIGGDMESAAFYAVTRWAGIEGILIKSICDWGDDNNDPFHPLAAANSARFVLHLVRVGALAGSRMRTQID